MRKLGIALSKGGVGKTTTAINLSAGLAKAGYNILLIDCDTQGQAGRALGVQSETGLAKVVSGELQPVEAMVQARERLWLLAGGRELAGVKRAIDKREFAAERTLAEALGPLDGRFHYVILDTAPGWDSLSVNVLFYVDEVLAPDGFHYTSNHATIWRWREAYQHDFFARIDWCVKSVEEANHPPQAKLNHANQLTVKSGEAVTLSAKGSSDPDGDKLTYQWIHYREPSSYLGIIKFEDDKEKQVKFDAPTVKKKETL